MIKNKFTAPLTSKYTTKFILSTNPQNPRSDNRRRSEIKIGC